MLKAIVLSVLILMLSGSVLAVGVMGLYVDGSSPPDPWNSCVNGVGFYPVEVWIWSLPGVNGVMCAEFAISYPMNVIQSTVYSNTAIVSVEIGSLPSGMSVCYMTCQVGWHWCFHQLLYVVDPTPTQIEIVPHPGVGAYHFANCEPGYPLEPFIVHTVFKINQMCPPENPVGTERTSWGTIKSMYDN